MGAPTEVVRARDGRGGEEAREAQGCEGAGRGARAGAGSEVARVAISRGAAVGPLRELRVFERVGAAGKKVYASWQEEEDALAEAAARGEEPPEWEDRWQEGGFEEAEAAEDWGEPDS